MEELGSSYFPALENEWRLFECQQLEKDSSTYTDCSRMAIRRAMVALRERGQVQSNRQPSFACALDATHSRKLYCWISRILSKIWRRGRPGDKRIEPISQTSTELVLTGHCTSRVGWDETLSAALMDGIQSPRGPVNAEAHATAHLERGKRAPWLRLVVSIAESLRIKTFGGTRCLCSTYPVKSISPSLTTSSRSWMPFGRIHMKRWVCRE